MDKSFNSCNYERIVDKNVDECIGICKGILSDDEFNENEKKFLIDWIRKHEIHKKNSMIKILYDELNNSTYTLDDLKEVLIRFTGGVLTPSDEIKSMSSLLPIEKDLQSIDFENKTFCLTGSFSSAFGNRKAIENIIKDKGGIIKDAVAQSLDYLVIGELGNNDWLHSNYGRKIQTALENKNKRYCETKIISEQQLLPFLENE
jgi:NAD-dependent DNA ligase